MIVSASRGPQEHHIIGIHRTLCLMSSISIMYSLSCYKYIVRKEGVTVSTPDPRQVVTLALSFGLSLNGRGRMDGGNDGGAALDGRVGLIRPSCTAVFVCQTWSWVLRRLQGVS